jgi:hypothetical protein
MAVPTRPLPSRVLLIAALALAWLPAARGATCDTCHSAEYNLWSASPHADTQLDLAAALSDSYTGQTPAAVIAGQDCIACHSPTSITANGGMTEAQAMAHFFTTSNGVFTAGTVATNGGAWPHVSCTACHLVAQPHEFIAARLALFESRTAQYSIMTNAAQLCGQCHGDLRFTNAGQTTFNTWQASPHGHSQTNVARGLSQYHVGQTPADLVNSTNAENCVACHSPTSVLVRNGDEALAIANFFTSSNGVFTAATTSANTGTWPNVECVACHDPHAPGQVSYFNSSSQEYQVMQNPGQLCGQCHGTLRFPASKYRLYDAWAGSKHADSQGDLAAGLRDAHAGQTPQQVLQGTNSANCIACHAPTSVRATGGSEAAALSHFFTMTNGVFSKNTAMTNTAEWPGVACTSCHDPHVSGQLAYFNSTLGKYQSMTNSSQLCGQCHGDLRFADSKYRTYNILAGKGGIGVPDQQLMGDVTCTECHMHSSETYGSNSKMAAGHSWSVSVDEPGGGVTVSCLNCHDTATPELAYMVINGWRSEYQTFEATVVSNVTAVAAAVNAWKNAAAASALAEAQYNLTYAQSDESGGFHNHPYLMSLLRAANEKALSIRLLNAAKQGTNVVVSWVGSGTLQTASSIRGPWQDVTPAKSPMTFAPPAAGQQRFYRLRQ